MPNTDIPAIFAVADRYALAQSILTDPQRAAALQAIAMVRELSSGFLDKAEQIIQGGAADSAELFNTAMLGARVDTAMIVALKTLWIMEDAVFKQRSEAIAKAARGKESTNSGS